MFVPISNFALRRRFLLLAALLCSVLSARSAPVISEFLAANDLGLKDEDGAFSDWIEVHNPDNAPVSLAGYSLTDSPNNLRKWVFPNVTVDAGAYLVVFASGKDRQNPGGSLHTNFQLAQAGEYLALVAPDGLTRLTEFTPFYPAQYEDTSFGIAAGEKAYFNAPTPGAANGSGSPAGPALIAAQKDPPQPVTGPLTITVKAVAVNRPVAGVQLIYKRMFTPEAMLEMKDDGQGEDLLAGDGVWTGVIPQNAFAPGEMTRWRFVARDSAGSQTKEPAFRSATDSPQYFGTVAQDERIRSRLPVLHWFTSNPNGAGNTTGSRGSVYYDNEFYDNVLFSIHGQSSSGFPKKSYNIDFNRGNHFRWSTNAERVADIDLLTNWADKSKVRHVLAYEIMRQSGVAAHFAYTVRVQQNGNFFSTADIVEDADETYLERAGLNKDGALYKVYSNLLNKDAGNTATSGVEKKTRKFENNNDLQALINGLDLTGTALVNYLYDNIDLARCVNMLAASSVIRNIDMHSKNWYIYRDTGRSDEWAILPWDLDLSQGRVWNTQNTYFDNGLYTDGFVVNGTAVRLVAELFANPSMRAMIMRRIRTLSDRFLQPAPTPGTSDTELYYERRLQEQSLLIDPPSIVPSDAQLDFMKWGSWLQGGTVVGYTNTNIAVESMAEGIARFRNEYLPARRKYIYETQIAGRGGEIPLPQTGGGPTTNFVPLVVRGASAKAFVPSNGDLGQSWTGNPANEPFDTSQWLSGTTGIGYERASGYGPLIGLNVDTQMKNNNSIYVRVEFEVSDPAEFQQLQLQMKYDDAFVAYLNGVQVASANVPARVEWNSAASASHEANPAAFVIFDVSDKKSALRPGRNVLAIQGINDTLASSDMLILPEFYGGKVIPPSNVQPRIDFGKIEANPASGNQDEEFVQLTNPNSMAVDISDWRVTGAIEHKFVGGTVLPARGSIYLSRNAAAFRARTVSPKGGEALFVQGPYHGHLSNFGESLFLVDDRGETNNTATYAAEPSDGQRYLVVSELMYHPAGDGLAEFIELLNISTNRTLDLSGMYFSQGVEFDFTGSAITSLAPGGRALVVRDLAAFQARYGSNLPVAGVFTNGTALNNSGEALKLEDARNGTIREFTFGDAPPWPADRAGYSLELIAPESNPDPSEPANWRASAALGGTPGYGESSGGYPADPAGDADGNGELDLIDYALGSGGGERTIYPHVQAAPDGTLEVSYPHDKNASGVQLAVQMSDDLEHWQEIGDRLELISRSDLGRGRELLTWRVRSPLREAPGLFLRLQAVGP